MIFCIKADAEIEADDIVDVFVKISEYYAGLARSMNEDEDFDGRLFIGGSIRINPCQEDIPELDGQNAAP